MDPSALSKLLGEWQLWVVCGVAFAFGAVGGVINLGSAPEWWRRVVVGGIAAVAVLYITSPETGVALVGGSLAAGYAGQAVLNALQSKVELALTKEDAREAVDALESSLMTPAGGKAPAG